MSRLQDRYKNEIVPQLAEKFGRKNPLSLPRIQKVVVSMGLGKAATQGEKDRLEEAAKHLAQLTGQRALITLSKKAVSGFRLREGMKVGAKVTLRGPRMYEFIDRFITIALPRVRDFRGVNNKLRRPRQLQRRRHRADDLSGDRGGQDEVQPGHEHHLCHRQRDGRRVVRTPQGVRHAL